MAKPTSRIASVCNEIGTGHIGTLTFAAGRDEERAAQHQHHLLQQCPDPRSLRKVCVSRPMVASVQGSKSVVAFRYPRARAAQVKRAAPPQPPCLAARTGQLACHGKSLSTDRSRWSPAPRAGSARPAPNGWPNAAPMWSRWPAPSAGSRNSTTASRPRADRRRWRPMDVTDEGAMAHLCRSIHDRWGRADIWVPCRDPCHRADACAAHHGQGSRQGHRDEHPRAVAAGRASSIR